ncbi:MAG: hypothetical protein DRI24_06020 [Deltaproteobacteria bacterium]|nr:MAG: hypothetical protein DRI24_06020 [Deltaproteobacteria bacterium]
MKSEYILWIAICLIYVVSVLVKRARAASNTGEKEGAKKPPAWVEKLNKFVSQIQERDRQGEVFEDPDPGLEENYADTIELTIEEPPLPEIKPLHVKMDTERPVPADSGKEILSKDKVYGIQDLRKAVIWSEILAPPLALRDE